MQYQNLLDNHSHSCFSPDSEASVNSLCEAAIAKGLKAYAITDHCECDLYEIDGYDREVPKSFEAIQAAKLLFPQLKLLCGIEVGQPLQQLQVAEELVKRPYDVVLGSLHRAKGKDDYYFLDYSGYSQKDLNDLMEEYYQELYQMARWGKFDIMTHLTYPLRYIVGDFGLHVDVNAFSDVIAETFRLLAQNGKALEINVSGLHQNIGLTLPDLKWITLFRDLGGEFIAVGSDAHCAEHVGVNIEQGMKVAYEAGFRSTVYFENRRVQTLPLE